MAYYAKVIEDTIANHGVRITTMELCYPRFIHSEIMTHRDRARNSASSRAIPFPKMLERIQSDPVIPIRFGSEQKGMQTGGEIDDPEEARMIWLSARDTAVFHAKNLAKLGVHKSICNRLVEPFMYITVVMTATDWNNFFRLRLHPDAEIHFQELARLMKEALDTSFPQKRNWGEWHLPYVTLEERTAQLEEELLAKLSTARCARVSYLTHDGVPDRTKDLNLFDRLTEGSGFGHWSPMEHPAIPNQFPDSRSGPYRGWVQFRKLFPNECAKEE